MRTNTHSIECMIKSTSLKCAWFSTTLSFHWSKPIVSMLNLCFTTSTATRRTYCSDDTDSSLLNIAPLRGALARFARQHSLIWQSSMFPNPRTKNAIHFSCMQLNANQKVFHFTFVFLVKIVKLHFRSLSHNVLLSTHHVSFTTSCLYRTLVYCIHFDFNRFIHSDQIHPVSQ